MPSRGRDCIHCGARMSRLAEACPACGGRNEPEVPWYAYALGVVLALLLVLALADLEPALGLLRGGGAG